MSKKYYPSGYQIIDLTDIELTGGDAFTPDLSEDAKILYNLMKTREIYRKPILLKLRVDDFIYMGLASIYELDDHTELRVTLLGNTSDNETTYAGITMDESYVAFIFVVKAHS